jgi:hypothetical protein
MFDWLAMVYTRLLAIVLDAIDTVVPFVAMLPPVAVAVVPLVEA